MLKILLKRYNLTQWENKLTDESTLSEFRSVAVGYGCYLSFEKNRLMLLAESHPLIYWIKQDGNIIGNCMITVGFKNTVGKSTLFWNQGREFSSSSIPGKQPTWSDPHNRWSTSRQFCPNLYQQNRIKHVTNKVNSLQDHSTVFFYISWPFVIGRRGYIWRSTIDLVILFDCACVDECCFLDPTKVFTEQGRYLRKPAGNRAPVQYLQSYFWFHLNLSIILLDFLF